MKKKILSVMIVLAMILCLVGCDITYQEATEQTEANEDFANGYFTVIKKWTDGNNYRIVYANDTKVKYMVISTGYYYGITPLYNADGTLQVYEENDPKEVSIKRYIPGGGGKDAEYNR